MGLDRQHEVAARDAVHLSLGARSFSMRRFKLSALGSGNLRFVGLDTVCVDKNRTVVMLLSLCAGYG